MTSQYTQHIDNMNIVTIRIDCCIIVTPCLPIIDSLFDAKTRMMGRRGGLRERISDLETDKLLTTRMIASIWFFSSSVAKFLGKPPVVS